MDIQAIKKQIEANIIDCEAQVISQDGRHFEAVVISAAFNGLSRLQQQQKVYAAVNEYIVNGSIHALSLKTLTPQEFSQSNSCKE